MVADDIARHSTHSRLGDKGRYAPKIPQGLAHSADRRALGRAGDDCINGGRGKDRIKAGAGDDVVRPRRGARDRIRCGPGDDVAFINPKRDRVKPSCETLRTR